MRLEITQQHLDTSIPQCIHSCLLATAVKDALKCDEVYVSSSIRAVKYEVIGQGKKQKIYYNFSFFKMNEEAFKLMLAFDAREHVEPCFLDIQPADVPTERWVFESTPPKPQGLSTSDK